LQKNFKYFYKSRASFMEDVQLMRNNCYEYNSTRNPHLLPVVDGVLYVFEDQLKEVLKLV
jgi:hypothetical protein